MVFDDKLFIANKIKLARKNAKMTQEKLAEIIDISVQQLSRIEVGTYMPSVPTFLKIIDTLSLSLEDFGINACVKENVLKNKLIKQISSLNETELQCCDNAIQTALINYKICKSKK